jgi:drug/metabolite transporter (DMT)-like permease
MRRIQDAGIGPVLGIAMLIVCPYFLYRGCLQLTGSFIASYAVGTLTFILVLWNVLLVRKSKRNDKQ